MVITVTEYDDSRIMLGSHDKRFVNAWGDFIKTYNHNLFNEMENLATWVNNTIKEECLFEVV